MGFLKDSQGIMNRYINVNGAWEDHLNRSRQFILNSLTGKSINNLAVYGSGWLLDFPLEEIAHRTGHIRLYDLAHPSQIVHRIRKFSNVTAVTSDITGGAIIAAYNAVRMFKKKSIKPSPEQLCSGAFEPDLKPDYAVSLNIFSQLGDFVTSYLGKHIPLNSEEIDRITRLLQESHLRLLQPGKSCLITDVRENGYDSESVLKITKELIRCSMPRAIRKETWKWKFDPLGEYNPGVHTVSDVLAIEL